MTQYLLVDSQETLISAFKFFGMSYPDNLEIVALDSAGMLACEKSKLNYTTIDQFSSRQEIIRHGWNNYSSLDSFCEIWDDFAKEQMEDLKIRDIKPFRYNYFNFKILIDSISVKILLLDNFIQKANGSMIYYSLESSRNIMNGNSLWPRNDVSIFSVLAKNIFNKNNLKPLPYPLSRSLFRYKLSDCYKYGVYAAIIIRGFCKKIIIGFYKKTITNFFVRINKSQSYCCFNLGHDVGYVIQALKLKKIYPLYMGSIIQTKVQNSVVFECERLWMQLVSNDEFRNYFSVNGLEYFSLIQKQLKYYIEVVLSESISSYDKTQRMLSIYNPAFSLSGTINLGLSVRCNMLAAQKVGAPLITYTEGAGYGSCITPIYDYTEICDGDVMLCYGSGNVEYYDDLGRPAKKIICVGSAHQQAVYKSLNNMKPPTAINKVMYVGTGVNDNINHLPNNGLISTCYFKTQLKILRYLESFQNTPQAIAKISSADPVSSELLKDSEFQHIQIETKNFEKVIDGIDLYIIDFPSTVLLSSINTNSYVFVLIEEGISGLTKKQKERLETRAYIFDRYDEMEMALQEIIFDVGKYPPRLGDEYLSAFSGSLCDENIASRVADVLVELVGSEL